MSGWDWHWLLWGLVAVYAAGVMLYVWGVFIAPPVDQDAPAGRSRLDNLDLDHRGRADDEGPTGAEDGDEAS